MHNEAGKGVICLGDKTSHGGEVITASDAISIGIPIATEGCMTHCPKCKGDFVILPNAGTRVHKGKAAVYHDDKTDCGASLISSL